MAGLVAVAVAGVEQALIPELDAGLHGRRHDHVTEREAVDLRAIPCAQIDPDHVDGFDGQAAGQDERGLRPYAQAALRLLPALYAEFAIYGIARSAS